MYTCTCTMYIQDPVKIVLGTERKAKGIGHKRKCVEVEETMVYIPLIDTLRVLLGNHTVVAEVRNFVTYVGTIEVILLLLL